MIEKSTKKDIKKIAITHMLAFPDSFSTKLGKKYCTKMFEWYLSTDSTFLFHMKIDNNIVGYCGGKIAGSLGSGSTTAMMQFTFKQAIKSLLLRPWLFFNSIMISNYLIIYKNILLKLGVKKKKVITTKKHKNNDNFKSVGLVVIGVNEKHQGLGYGSKILIEFEKRCKSIGAKKINLSVKNSNLSAIKSYSRNGWLVDFSNNYETKFYKLI